MEENRPLQILGLSMIILGFFYVIFHFLPNSIDTILILSRSYSTESDLGEGSELILAFSTIVASLIISLGILITYISKHYSKKARLYVISSLLVWFIFDSIASYMFGFEYNVILNVFFISVFLFFVYLANRAITK